MLCDICNTSMSRSQYLLHRATKQCNPRDLNDSVMKESMPEISKDAKSIADVVENGVEIVMEEVVSEISKNAENIADVVENGVEIVLEEVVPEISKNAENIADVVENGVEIVLEEVVPEISKNAENIADVVENGVEIVLKEVVPEISKDAENIADVVENGVEIVLQESSSVQLTKKGNVRIRQSNSLSVKERKERKQQIFIKKYGLKPISNCCKQRCIVKIDEERRKEINAQYLKLNWMERKTFILNMCERMPIKRRIVEDGPRKNTWKYFLNDANSAKMSVCKKFFLTTLGYKYNNDRVVFEVLNKTPAAAITPLADGRGRHASQRRYKHADLVDSHIESFEPTISHYRREHAPNIRYLPSDISICMMHEDFVRKNPDAQISYEYYRLAVKNKRISFANLGHEECENCEKFKLHEHSKENRQNDCNTCQQWEIHSRKAEEARHLYIKDAELNDGSIFSVDLQKIIMLPRLDSFKKAIFTRRIVAYHESFVPVGKKSPSIPYACIWHEGITGRNKEDLISTFYSFFLRQRDVKKVTLWLDNCSSQNKNWCLLSFIIYIVNSDEVDIEEIQLKYFEPGHTFMSADSFHHQVELSMKREKIYDFPDFSKAVQNANKGKVEVKEMSFDNFYSWKDNKSQQKLKKLNDKIYLSNIVALRATRGKFILQYKTRHTEEFTKSLDFLCKKACNKTVSKPPQLSKPCGVAQDKIDSILSNLSDLMPASRRRFWNDLKN